MKTSFLNFVVVAMAIAFRAGIASPIEAAICKGGCQIGSEDAYGSVWEPQLYNYTVQIITVVIDTGTGSQLTTHNAPLNNPRSIFEVASASIQSLQKFHHGVFVVNGTKTEMLGTTLTWPDSDLRLAKYTATATFKGEDTCRTTTSVYTRPTERLWERMVGTADESWLSKTWGVCNPCPTGAVSEIGTRLGDIPKRLYTTNSELASCTKATMNDEPMTKVALVPVTSTRTIYIGGERS